VRKLLGKNDIEDALKRLDTLTMEEARMAVAENLKVTNRVDGKVDKVDSKVEKVDDKVDMVDDKVGKVDNKVTVLVDAANEEKRSYFSHIAVGSLNLSILPESLLREKSKKWLSPPDPSTNHNIARKAHHKGTASWFFQSRIYEEWKSSPSFLWIHGKRTLLSSMLPQTPLTPIFAAGSGKSILWFVISFFATCIYSYSFPALA
jgi:hypothetical protein